MARSATVTCTETPSHSRGPGNIRVRFRVSFTTGAVRSAILATAGLLVELCEHTGRQTNNHTYHNTSYPFWGWSDKWKAHQHQCGNNCQYHVAICGHRCTHASRGTWANFRSRRTSPFGLTTAEMAPRRSRLVSSRRRTVAPLRAPAVLRDQTDKQFRRRICLGRKR